MSRLIHTEIQAFGKVMSAIKPRLAVGYHPVQSPENNAAIMDAARKTYDGPVSFMFEYAGMRVFFSGDTVPNKWFVKYGTGVDLAIHEAMMTPQQYMDFYNQPAQLAWHTCCELHTSPESFGKILSTIKPRHAVAFHFFDEEGTRYAIYEAIRSTHDGLCQWRPI